MLVLSNNCDRASIPLDDDAELALRLLGPLLVPASWSLLEDM